MRSIAMIYRPEPIDYEPLLNLLADEIKGQLDRGTEPGELFTGWEKAEKENPIFFAGERDGA